MNLHEHKEEFEELIAIVADYIGVPADAVRRDYYIVQMMQNLQNSEYAEVCVFKGGTSLSKCYPGSINRFSEDIDLTFIPVEDMTNKKYSKALKRVEDTISAGFLMEKIEDERNDRNKSAFVWPENESKETCRVKLEIGSSVRPDPFSKRSMKTYIQEYAGYREVLSTIHEGYEYINPRPNIILQLHRDLYSYSQGAAGGSYKNSDNVIAETDAEGHQKARFIPVPAFQTAEAMEELCTRFLEAWEADRIDKLVLIPMFILDFLCIHPFNDGNGRMSRLLTLLLFYKAGYIVGKYISMEMLIEKTKETYYEALQASSTGWHEGENSYEPFVKYYLGIMLKAYNEFESRVEHLKHRSLSKPDRIKAVIDNKVGKITKKEIMELCPDISKITVERTLTNLVKSGYIAKVGAGPSTGYVRV